MTAREAVLLLVEERPRQLQTHPHQPGPVDQDRTQRGDGLVQQRLPVRLRDTRHPRGLDRGQTEEEANVRALGVAPCQRAQHLQRFGRPPPLEQRRPGLGHARVGRENALGGAQHRRGEHSRREGRCRQCAAKAFEGRRHVRKTLGSGRGGETGGEYNQVAGDDGRGLRIPAQAPRDRGFLRT